MKTVCAIIQARMGSTRLPGKVLKELSGKPVLGHIIDRLQLCKHIDWILVATSTHVLDDQIVTFCKKYKTLFYRGDEDDVLKRYCAAVRECGSDVIVRITADNCLIDPKIIDEMVKAHINDSYDYTCIKNLSCVAGEVINSEALKKASELTQKAYDREHVTPFLREHPDLFKVKELPEDFSGIPPKAPLTIDTPRDFEFIKKIYSLFYPGEGIVDNQKVYNYLNQLK